MLRSYSKQQRPEIAAISVLEDARRDAKRAQSRRTPSGIRNVKRARERVRVLDQDEVDELVDCYLAGDSTYTLSRRFGIRRDTVVAHLKRRGIVRRRANGLIVLDVHERQQVVEFHRNGWSVRRVAATLGHSERVIARTLDEAGIERRTINMPSKRATRTIRPDQAGIVYPSAASSAAHHSRIAAALVPPITLRTMTPVEEMMVIVIRALARTRAISTSNLFDEGRACWLVAPPPEFSA